MPIRPRLLAVSLVVALAVSVTAGWALSRSGDDQVPPDEVIAAGGVDVPDDEIDDVLLDTPGEYQQPLDDALERAIVVGSALPRIELEDGAGMAVSTGALIGEAAVINVWFSACPPCARELADFADVHREVGDRVRFVGVNPFDPPDVMRRFASDRDVAFELWRDTDGVFLEVMSVISFPRTYFVDERGAIVHEAGVLDADELRDAIEDHLT